jgi:hypothetical protein
VTEAPPGAPRTFRDRCAVAWPVAAIRGGVAFGGLLALSTGLGILAAVGPSSGSEAFRQAALVPALVHRVPVEAGPVSFRVALLLATAGAGILLFLGGRAVAGRAGGSPGVRAALGATVAVPYALGAVVVSLVALGATTRSLGSVTAGASEVAPSIPGSAVWPLVLAVVCGAAGGVAAAPPGDAAERRVRSAVAGGWRAAWLVVLLAAAGFLVVMALHPSVVRGYVDAAFRRGPATGSLALAGTALLLPNAGTGVASASMGGGVEIQALESSCVVVSYGRIPESAGTAAGPCGRLPFRLGTPAPGYFVFLLVPVAATLAGGWLAARRAGAVTAGDGALAGAVAGVAFAGLVAVLAGVARISSEAAGPLSVVVGEVQVAVGPDPLAGFLLGLAWGLAGGATGGALAARRRTADGPG